MESEEDFDEEEIAYLEEVIGVGYFEDEWEEEDD